MFCRKMVKFDFVFEISIIIDSINKDTSLVMINDNNPTPRKALFVGWLVGSSRFLPHLTQTHTPEHVR